MDYPIITYTLSKDDIQIDEEEVLRYLGYTKSKITQEDIQMIRERIPLVRNVISGRACYGRYSIELLEKNQIVLPYGTITSKDLTRNLTGCSEIFIFAATIGLPFDRLLQTTRLRSMAEAAIVQAIGAASVENVCDTLNDKLKEEILNEGRNVKPRYSAGFGDYSLNNQKGIFEVLNPSKYAGITLKDNLIMAPEKSVTALIGII